MAEKKTESALVRELIEREVKSGERRGGLRHLAGSVRLKRLEMHEGAWADHLRAMNWRK